jgi:hypothetical protein
MSNLKTEKRVRVVDGIICAVIGSLYAYATWVLKRHVDASSVIRIALVFWSMVILIRFARLLQYMTTYNIDLTRYIDRDLDDIEIPFKHKFKEWKSYLKEPLNRARPFYVVFFLIYILHIFIKFHDGLYFVTTGLLLLTFVTIILLSITRKADEYVATVYSNYKPEMSGRHRKIEVISYIKRGFIAAVVFDLCMVLLVNLLIYHYVLLFMAFCLLYSFSAIQIHLYKSFSEAISTVLGHKFDQLPLRMGYPY